MQPLRVLLATPGWPSGILDLASWITREGLAHAVIVQIQPGLAFSLPSEYADHFPIGRVDPGLVDFFARQGYALSTSEEVVLRPQGWVIRDPNQKALYHLIPTKVGFDVLSPENLFVPQQVARYREGKASEEEKGEAVVGRACPADLSAWPRPEVEHAARWLGVGFLTRLLQWRPHVVGFRIEGGQFEQICQFVQAVRRFSHAEIILGGPTATSHPLEVLEQCGADYVFAGEAEESLAQFLRLARQPNSRDRQPEIPGLAYRYGGRCYLNTLPRDGYGRSVLQSGLATGLGERKAIARNLERPQVSAAVLVANRLDWSLLDDFRRPFDSLFFTGGRGCPGACTFCAKLHGQEVRVKDARQLIEEIAGADDRVADGGLRVTRWRLFEHVDDPRLQDRDVAWAAIYDEDFFLHRRRAIEFFALWAESPLADRYRISLQTNPCSLLAANGRPHAELLAWIGRVKPMVQVGAESFHPELLTRWHKRHTLEQLETVLDALDATGQDYTVFQLLTDFDSTAKELLESLARLACAARHHPRMRIASSPYTIPLYDSDTRPLLEHAGRAGADRVRHFTDYERTQPGWMDPLTAELADLADAELHEALQLASRDNALLAAFEAILDYLTAHPACRTPRFAALIEQALAASASG